MEVPGQHDAAAQKDTQLGDVPGRHFYWHLWARRVRFQGGAPWRGRRVVVRRVWPLNDFSNGRYRAEVVPRVRVLIAGPSGSVVKLTDKEGIYDVTDLPSGHYSIRAEVYGDIRNENLSCPEAGEPELKAGSVWGCTLNIR